MKKYAYLQNCFQFKQNYFIDNAHNMKSFVKNLENTKTSNPLFVCIISSYIKIEVACFLVFFDVLVVKSMVC